MAASSSALTVSTCRAAGCPHQAGTQASVAAHLGKMLSTRAGSVQTLPDFGLPDLNNMGLSLHEALQQTGNSIATFIEAHEPRLRDVQIHTTEGGASDDLHLTFSITATLILDDSTCPASFNSRLATNGQVRVK